MVKVEAVEIGYYVQLDHKALTTIKSLGYLDKTKYPKFRKEYFMSKRRVRASLMFVLFTIFFTVSLCFSFHIENVKADDDKLTESELSMLAGYTGIIKNDGKLTDNLSTGKVEGLNNYASYLKTDSDILEYFKHLLIEFYFDPGKPLIDYKVSNIEKDFGNKGIKDFLSKVLGYNISDYETYSICHSFVNVNAPILIYKYIDKDNNPVIPDNPSLKKFVGFVSSKSKSNSVVDNTFILPVYFRVKAESQSDSKVGAIVAFLSFSIDGEKMTITDTELSYIRVDSKFFDEISSSFKKRNEELSDKYSGIGGLISKVLARYNGTDIDTGLQESAFKEEKKLFDTANVNATTKNAGSASGAIEDKGNGKQALDINKINQDDMDFNYIDVSLQAAFSQYNAKGIKVTGTAIKPGKKHNNKKLTFYDLYTHNIDISKKKYNGASLSAISFKNNYTLEEVFKNSNDEIDKLKDVSNSDKGPIQHIMLAPLIKYIYATMGDLAKNGIVSAGAIGTQQGSGDNANAEVSNVKKYYSAFENILKTVTEYEASSSPNFDLYKDQFGTMRHIKTVTNAAMYLKPMITLENTLNYVKSLNGWEEKDDNGKKLVHNKDLDKAISEASTSTDGDKSKYFTTNSDLAILAQVVKNVKEAMNYMGIKPFDAYTEYMYSDTIYNALKDINFLQKLANYDFTDDKQPLKVLFDTEQSKFSSWYLYGSSLSSWYIPLKTNSYKPQDVLPMKSSEELTDWLTNFHVKYGFYRKALYIDTNLTSTTDYFADDNYMPNKMRIATLRDLTEYKKDNLLYIDDNFYNADSVMENFTRSKSAGDIIKDSVSGAISGAIVGDKINNDFAKKVLQQGALNQEIDDNNAVLKNKGYNTYLDSLLSHAKAYGEKTPVLGKLFDIFEHLADGQQIFSDSMDVGDSTGVDELSLPKDKDGKPIRKNQIKNGIEQDYYDWKQPFAIVSAIYRDKSLGKMLQGLATKQPPVFMSSPNLWQIQSAKDKVVNTLYSQMMIMNLSKCIEGHSDLEDYLDKPLYMDIYGNILLDNGLIVIPAASNPALFKSGQYVTTNLGLMYLYSQGNRFTRDELNDDIFEKISNYFAVHEDTNQIIQKDVKLGDVVVSTNLLVSNNESLQDALRIKQNMVYNDAGYDVNSRLWIAIEALRGAPMEFIDTSKEGIKTEIKTDKYGLYLSTKLDTLADKMLSTNNGNSIVSMPNLAFIPHIEWFILFAIKSVIILVVFYILVQIYMMAVSGKFTVYEGFKHIAYALLFAVVVSLLPKMVSYSYSEPNKILLQNELTPILLHNADKNLTGREVSATGVTDVKSSSKFYLKLDQIKLPWYNVIRQAMVQGVTGTLSDIYNEELSKHPLFSDTKNIEIKADGAYISVDNLFASSTIGITSDNILYQNPNESLTASYFTPYYFFIDDLLYKVSEFNKDNEIKPQLSIRDQKGISKSIGLLKPYLTSKEFLEETDDMLSLKQYYGFLGSMNSYLDQMSEGNKDAMRDSIWDIRNFYTDEQIISGIDQLYSFTRKFIADNRGLLDNVTDESFIKTMALSVAMKYNGIFKVPYARQLEIFDIDTKDLIKASITTSSSNVYSSYSFGRFVYQEAGVLGVIITSLLIPVYFLLSLLRPTLVLVILMLCVFNFILKKLVERDKEEIVLGFLFTVAIMILMNLSYALVLKLIFFFIKLGANTVLALLLQLFAQLLYLYLIAGVIKSLIKNPTTFASADYRVVLNTIVGGLGDLFNGTFNKGSFYKPGRTSNRYGKKRHDYFGELVNRDKQRDRATEENIDNETLQTRGQEDS